MIVDIHVEYCTQVYALEANYFLVLIEGGIIRGGYLLMLLHFDI